MLRWSDANLEYSGIVRVIGKRSCPVNAEDMVKALEATGDYRVLCRLRQRDVFETTLPGQELKIGILIDLETTGLDTTSDEVIELGMVKFAYIPGDRVGYVIETFAGFNE